MFLFLLGCSLGRDTLLGIVEVYLLRTIMLHTDLQDLAKRRVKDDSCLCWLLGERVAITEVEQLPPRECFSNMVSLLSLY